MEMKDGLSHDLKVLGSASLLWPLAFLVFTSGFVSFFSLRALGSIVPVFCVVTLGVFVYQRRAFPKPSWNLIITWVTFVALVGLAALRSLNIDYATGRFIKLAMMTLVAILLWEMVRRIDVRRALRPVLILSFFIGLFLCLVEGMTGGGLFWLTHKTTVYEALNSANRPAVLLVLFLWPAGFALEQLVRREMVWGVILLTVVISCTTESQSAELAAIIGALTFFVCLIAPRFTFWATGIGGILIILLMPFFFAYFQPMLGEGSSFFSATTFLARLEIWNFVANKIMAQPILGYGLEAGRFIPLEPSAWTYFKNPYLHHPHNGVLQVWLEMGLIGALALALAWGALVRQIGKLDVGVQRYMLTGLTTVLVISSVSHGLWQSWWMSALGLLPFLYVISLPTDFCLSDREKTAV